MDTTGVQTRNDTESSNERQRIKYDDMTTSEAYDNTKTTWARRLRRHLVNHRITRIVIHTKRTMQTAIHSILKMMKYQLEMNCPKSHI